MNTVRAWICGGEYSFVSQRQHCFEMTVREQNKWLAMNIALAKQPSFNAY
jgi:hypothetical protein